MRRRNAVLLALLLAAPALSGCLARSVSVLAVDAPRPEAWSPSSLLLAAVASVDGDPEATTLLEYDVVFDEERILRILKLRFHTHHLETGRGFFVSFHVARPYDAATDRVELRGFVHAERGDGDRPDPAKEWRLRQDVLEVLDRHTFAQLAAVEADRLGDVAIVYEFRLGANLRPRAAEDGTWRLWQAGQAAVEPVEGNHTLEFFARPRLPPTLVVQLHTPCMRSFVCPDSDVHPFLVEFPMAAASGQG